MPPLKKASKKNTPPGNAAARADRISELPDDTLQHVVSFLPVHDAVRTCVLAKRWRDIWKSATGLRVMCGDEDEEEPAFVKELGEFVDRLLLVRGGSPLDTCEFRLLEYEEEDVPRINRWIRQALRCKVQVLRTEIFNGHCCFELHDASLISQHLKKLEFHQDIEIPGRALDFSSCPVLEHLELHGCFPEHAISSQSLKHLVIHCCFLAEDEDFRFRIYTPNLVSLFLRVQEGLIPFFQCMPSLVEAVVEVDRFLFPSLYPDYQKLTGVILPSLSEAQSLELRATEIDMFMFTRDLKFCRPFNKLKTLLLNEYWCEPISTLAYLLEHSPVLEKLTLELYSSGSKNNVSNLIGKPMEISAAVSEHLKIVEIKCKLFGKKVIKVLKFLGKHNIWFNFDGIEVVED